MGKSNKKYLRKLASSDRVQHMLRDLSSARDQERTEQTLRESRNEDLFVIDKGLPTLGGDFDYSTFTMGSDSDDDDDDDDVGSYDSDDDDDVEMADGGDDDDEGKARRAAITEERRQKKREKKKKNKRQQRMLAGAPLSLADRGSSSYAALSRLESEGQIDNVTKELFRGDIDALREKKKRLHRAELELDLLRMGQTHDTLLVRPIDRTKETAAVSREKQQQREKLLRKKAQSAIRAMEHQVKQEQKKKEEEEKQDAGKAQTQVYDLWGGDGNSSRRRARNAHGRIKLILPHAGQSVNPRLEDYKDAVKSAFSAEMEVYLDKKELSAKLQVDMNDPAVQGDGDDVADGFKARFEGEEEISESVLSAEERELIAKKLRARLGFARMKKASKANVLLQNKRTKYKSLAKKFNRDVDRIPEIIKEIEERSEQRREKRRQQRLRRQELEDAKHRSIVSAGDIQLGDEMTQRLSHHNGDSLMLFHDLKRSLVNANIIPKKRSKRQRRK